jgi:Bifunctional DNA primase/polymerase, N-terminal
MPTPHPWSGPALIGIPTTHQPARKVSAMPQPAPTPLALALNLAAAGWHVFPLSRSTKRPLPNCVKCRPAPDGTLPHPPDLCPCIVLNDWCHGVRAATTKPARIERWWHLVDHAAVGAAAGPSNLVLIDIDHHGDTPPADLATKLLPGIDLRTEPIDPDTWQQPGRFRTGRDTLHLLTHLRGGQHPWPSGPNHQPVTADTPSGGRHLWYRAPTGTQLRQAIGALAWQVDIKAGWSYGLAPGTPTTKGTYHHHSGNPTHPGTPPDWLTHELVRVASTQTAPTTASPNRPALPPLSSTTGPAAYLTTVLNRGAADLAAMSDGRQTALAHLAYKAGGYLTWSGLTDTEVLDHLTTAGTTSGLPYPLAHSIARRSLNNGQARPLTPPPPRR